MLNDNWRDIPGAGSGLGDWPNLANLASQPPHPVYCHLEYTSQSSS